MTESYSTTRPEQSPIPVAEQANYAGNWMLLQQQRMQSEDFTARFNALMQRNAQSLKQGDQMGILDKETDYAYYYTRQIGQLATTIEHVYSWVDYVAAGAGRTALLGTSAGIGEPGTVYNDSGIEPRQKDIIAAHESAHGVVRVDGKGVARQEVLRCFDMGLLRQSVEGASNLSQNYLKNPDELLARMSQLKNYFGMQGNETFTVEHLAYAQEHYIDDTGLDNDMSHFFAAIRPEEFINGMNVLPL